MDRVYGLWSSSRVAPLDVIGVQIQNRKKKRKNWLYLTISALVAIAA
jgi:hypothetical protein